MSLESLVEEVESLLQDYIKTGRRVSPVEMGLDRRAGWDLWVSADNDCIGVEGNSALNALRYYGGFEYVDDEHVHKLGNWTFYTGRDCARVQGCLDRLETADSSTESVSDGV